MRPREDPPEDPPSELAAEAPLSLIVPSPYERSAYVHGDLKASLSRTDLTQTKGGQEQALWEEPVVPSPVVRKIGVFPAQERKRVRRSRQQGRADALQPSSLVASLVDSASDLAEGVGELSRELASNVVRPIGVGVQALASIGRSSPPVGLTDGLVAPEKGASLTI